MAQIVFLNGRLSFSAMQDMVNLGMDKW